MIDLYAEEMRENPYPVYESIREAGPVYFDASRNEFFVTRYRESVQVLVDAKTFSSAPAGFEDTVVGSGGTVHRSLRGALMPAFAREQRAEYDRLLRRSIHRALRNAKSGPFDVVADLASIAAGTLFEALLDVKPKNHSVVVDWVSRIVETSRKGLDEGEEFVGETADVTDVVEALRDRFRKATRSRPKALLMALVVHQYQSGQLSQSQLEDLGLVLTAATTETMMSTAGFCGYFLAALPGLQDQLRSNPGLIPSFVDEVLRFESPVQRRPRYAEVDTTIAGIDIPAGSFVTVLVGSANRDPREFTDPDTFLVDRAHNPHLSFGSGPHMCIGRQVGKSTLVIEVDELLKRTKRIELADMDVQMAHPTNWSIRGPRKVAVRIELSRA